MTGKDADGRSVAFSSPDLMRLYSKPKISFNSVSRQKANLFTLLNPLRTTAEYLFTVQTIFYLSVYFLLVHYHVLSAKNKLAGQSAGASSVGYHLLYKENKGSVSECFFILLVICRIDPGSHLRKRKST